jgi:DNA-binding MarR family transcriptional regulator
LLLWNSICEMIDLSLCRVQIRIIKSGCKMAEVIQNEIEQTRISKKNDPEINLYILLDQANSIVTNAVELELKRLHMTQPQVRVLTMLSREDRPVTLDELANWTLKEFNSVSTLINRMENKGLVEKIKKEGELKTYIVLTEKGSNLYHTQVTERSIHLIFEKLSTKEQQQLYNLLRKVRDTTRDLLGLDYRPPFLSE